MSSLCLAAQRAPERRPGTSARGGGPQQQHDEPTDEVLLTGPSREHNPLSGPTRKGLLNRLRLESNPIGTGEYVPGDFGFAEDQIHPQDALGGSDFAKL